jgi:hypothetical protein
VRDEGEELAKGGREGGDRIRQIEREGREKEWEDGGGWGGREGERKRGGGELICRGREGSEY